MVIIPDKSEWIEAARIYEVFSVFMGISKMETCTNSVVYSTEKNVMVSYRFQ